ncbi:hypothetical protein BGZ51_003029 [Haplosporangium sp. Z 767]|nr:hypothetical protein BGZ51_003029 [Haplosporangium sp. Z 767]
MDTIYYRPHRDRYNDDDSDNDIDPSQLTYSLEIVQQPQRARMCGFGDKDRRHITPAPVLKLIAKSADGRIIPARQLSRQAFVVNADLWLEDEKTERNLVLVSSIASTKLPSRPYHTSTTEIPLSGSHQPYFRNDNEAYRGDGSPHRMRHDQLSTPISPNMASSSQPSSRTSSSAGERYTQHPHQEDNSWRSYGERYQDEQQLQRSTDSMRSETDEYARYDRLNNGHNNDHHSTAHYVEEEVDWDNPSTQNLVGQTTVGGQSAPDLDGKTSHIWFAFSVLSIRTEGVFKLRFSLCDLMQISGGKTYALCHVFSDPIHVQSPKRFLGTCGKHLSINLFYFQMTLSTNLADERVLERVLTIPIVDCLSVEVDNNDIANHLNKYSIRIPSRKDEKPTRGQAS